MAVPKVKMSRANTRTRRSAWKAAPIHLQVAKDKQGFEAQVPRRLAKAVKLGLYTPDTWTD